MTWICKKCGQIQSDSVVYNDLICEECFEKLKMEEKKKSKISPFFRVLSLTLVISLMLCIFSGIGVAHADDTLTQDVLSGHKYKDFYAFKWTTNGYISLETIYNLHKGNYADCSKLYYYLIYFDESGQVHYYSSTVNNTYIAESIYRPESSNGQVLQFMNSSYYVSDTLSESMLKANSSVYRLGTLQDLNPNNTATTPATILSYTGLYSDSSAKLGTHVIHDGSNTDVPLFSDGIDYYLVVCPYLDEQGANSDNYYKNLLIDNASSGDLKADITYSQPDKPFIFSSMFPFVIDMSNAVDSGTGLVGVNYVNNSYAGIYMEWCRDKKAINPSLTFDIHDNNFKHNYELVISYNSTIHKDSLMFLSEQYNKSNSSFAQWLINNDLEWVYDGISNISDSTSFLDDAWIDACNAVNQDIIKKNPLRYTFDSSFTINSSAFNFSDSSSDVYRRIKINLNDFMTVTNTCLYRVQWRDKTDNQIIWTSYFATPDSFNKLSSPNGISFYDYNYSDYSGDDLMQSLPSDSSIVTDFYSSGDVADSILDNPIIDENGNTNWDNISLGGLYNPLNFGLSAVSDFFQSLWVIYPNEIRSIITIGISMVVILRLLGR